VGSRQSSEGWRSTSPCAFIRFAVDDHRGEHEYRLCYIHAAVGIIVALAEQL
jgi:hypothetical protein